MAKIFLGRQLTQLESIALESLYEKEHFKVCCRRVSLGVLKFLILNPALGLV